MVTSFIFVGTGLVTTSKVAMEFVTSLGSKNSAQIEKKSLRNKCTLKMSKYCNNDNCCVCLKMMAFGLAKLCLI